MKEMEECDKIIGKAMRKMKEKHSNKTHFTLEPN